MSRAKKLRKIAGKVLVWTSAALACLIVVALLAANTPMARRLIAKQVNAALAGVVSGQIVIESIGGVGLTRVSGVRARLRDSQGRSLIAASGVTASVRTYTLLRSLLGGSGLQVLIDSTSIDHIDVLVDADGDGNLRLAQAFLPKPEVNPAPPSPPGPPIHLVVSEARLASAWAHGVPASGFFVDSDLRGARVGVTLANGKTTIELRAVRIATRAMPLGANVHGNVDGRIELPPAPAKLSTRANFDGTVGGVTTKLQGALAEDRVDAHLDAEGPPGPVAKLVPALRLRAPAKVHLDADGTLPSLRAKGWVRSGPADASIAVDGKLGETLTARVELAADHVDLAALLEDAPASDLNAAVTVRATLHPEGRLDGTFDVATRPALLAAQPLPAAKVAGRFTESTGSASIDLAEPGAAVHVDADWNTKARPLRVSFDTTVAIPDLDRVRRLGSLGKGRATAHVRGTLQPTESTVRADVHLTANDVSTSGVDVKSADIAGVVAGSIAAPRIDATVKGQGVSAAGRSFETVSLTARGNLRATSITAELHGARGTPDLDASAEVAFSNPLAVRQVVARIGKEPERLGLRADAVRVAGGTIHIDGVLLEGAGAPVYAAGRLGPDVVDVRASSAGFDIGKVAKVLGVGDRGIRGKLALDVDLKTRGRTGRGKVGVELTDGAFSGVSGIELRVATSVDGQRFTGQIHGKVAGSHLLVDAQDLTLGGSPLSPRSWSRAFGHVDVDAEVDLERLAKVLPTAVLPFDDVGGKVVLTGDLTRGPSDASPETSWTLHTEGFRASAKSERQKEHNGTEVRAPPRWHTAGVDVDGSLAIAKERGSTTFSAHFRDRKGALLNVEASADLPYREVLSEPGGSFRLLSEVPFHVSATVPPRRLSSLPPILATAGIEGEVELSLEARDTLRAPTVEFTGKARKLEARGRRKAVPVDVRVQAHYGEGAGHVEIGVDCKEANALLVKSDVRAKVSELIDEGAAAPWDASLTGKFSRFPLDVLSLAGSRRIKGTLSGDLDAATGTKTPPRLSARLQADGFGVGRAPGGRASVNVDVDGRALKAKVRFDQPDGFAEATASAGIAWRTPLSPSVDPARGVARADAKASHFRLSALQPVVQGVVRELDGRVDADAHFEAATEHGAPKLDGSVVIDKTSFELTGPGQEFHDLHAKVVLRQNGTLRVDDLRAEGLTGTVKGNAEASFDGLHLRRAKVSVNIPQDDPFPITIEGQSIARASGNVTLEAVPSEANREIAVTVQVPKAKVELLSKPTHELQELDQDEHVRIGYHRTAKEFVIVPLEKPKKAEKSDEPGTTIKTTLKLGDIEVERGTDLRVRLEGEPRIQIGETTELSGQIRLRSGFLYVQGKKFEIESGTITFEGEPDNPNVVVTAGWTAPEGTRVYADFVGPLKTGKVTLRSEPAHTKSEILSLILFGSADGGGAGASPTPATAGVGVAGGAVTQGLNRALDDLTGVEITTRIDTSESNNPRPELEVRVARDVSVAVSHVIGVPPPGSNPDRNFATIDWRFLRNWSLDTTIGDLGSSILDLVWQYRY
jgi:translocation and assembly module TamB